MLKGQSDELKKIMVVSVPNALGMLVPLLSLPHLAKTLGPENFGALAFALIVTTMCSVLVDYGFNISATRHVAVNANDKQEISITLRAVSVIKIVAILTCTASIWIMSLANDAMAKSLCNVYASFMLLIGSIIYPIWLLQGMGKFGLIAISQLVSKLIVLLLTLSFVKGPEDLLLAVVLQSSWSMFSGIFCLKTTIDILKASNNDGLAPKIFSQLKSGFTIFKSTAVMSLYTNIGATIAAMIMSPASLAGFHVADRIIKAITGFYSVPITVLLPPQSFLARSNKKEFERKSIKILKACGFVSLLIFLASAISAPLLVNVVFGNNYTGTNEVLYIMMPLLFIVAISNVIGLLIMIPDNKEKEFYNILLVAGIFHLIIVAPLVNYFDAKGAAIAILTTEALITILMALWFLNHRKG